MYSSHLYNAVRHEGFFDFQTPQQFFGGDPSDKHSYVYHTISDLHGRKARQLLEFAADRGMVSSSNGPKVLDVAQRVRALQNTVL